MFRLMLVVTAVALATPVYAARVVVVGMGDARPGRSLESALYEVETTSTFLRVSDADARNLSWYLASTVQSHRADYLVLTVAKKKAKEVRVIVATKTGKIIDNRIVPNREMANFRLRKTLAAGIVETYQRFDNLRQEQLRYASVGVNQYYPTSSVPADAPYVGNY